MLAWIFRRLSPPSVTALSAFHVAVPSPEVRTGAALEALGQALVRQANHEPIGATVLLEDRIGRSAAEDFAAMTWERWPVPEGKAHESWTLVALPLAAAKAKLRDVERARAVGLSLVLLCQRNDWKTEIEAIEALCPVYGFTTSKGEWRFKDMVGVRPR